MFFFCVGSLCFSCIIYRSCCFFFFFFQNTAVSEKSCEALLGHVISELSKENRVYNVNPEETAMVRRHHSNCSSLNSSGSCPPPSSYKLVNTRRKNWLNFSTGLHVGGIHHCFISKLLTGYWSGICAVSLHSWAPVCGPHSLWRSAFSSSACPFCASPAFCSTTFMATAWPAAWYVSPKNLQLIFHPFSENMQLFFIVVELDHL